MKAILFFAFSLAIIIGAYADCKVEVSISPRVGGSYQVAGVNYQIYDIQDYFLFFHIFMDFFIFILLYFD